MRILSILPLSPPSPQIGGAEKQMHSLHRALRARGVDVQVLADIKAVGARYQEYEGVPIWGAPFPVLTAHPLRPGNLKLWLAWRQIRSLVGDRIAPVDLIQVTTFRQPAMIGYGLARILSVPWVVGLAGSGKSGDFAFFRSNWLQRWLLPRMAQDVTRVIALEEQTASEAREAGISAERLVTVPVGVVSAARAAPGDGGEGKAGVVFVGRLAAEKRIETLLQAFHAIQDRLGDGVPSLSLVGDGDRRTALEALSRDLDLQPPPEFVGWQQDPGQYLEKAICFVNPSESEGLPNAVIEACFHGAPVILSDIPVHREIATAVGMSDFLFRVGDSEAMAGSLMRFLKLPQHDREELAGRCRAYGQRFTTAARNEGYLAVYRQVLAEWRTR